jgi:hypothetical protein
MPATAEHRMHGHRQRQELSKYAVHGAMRIVHLPKLYLVS